MKHYKNILNKQHATIISLCYNTNNSKRKGRWVADVKLT